MNRRNFFGRLAAAGTAASVIAPQNVSEAGTQSFPFPTLDHPTRYNGYNIHWSGWKGSWDNNYRVGQWLAWHSSQFAPTTLPEADAPPYLYVNLPGFVGGPYYPGSTFDLSTRDDRFMRSETTAEQADAWIRAGYRYIQELVDVYASVPRRHASFGLWRFPVDQPILGDSRLI